MDQKKAANKQGNPEPGNKHPRSPGIGRSAITGRFMTAAAAKAHKKTAIVMGGRVKRT
jgi:hypothetical protein